MGLLTRWLKPAPAERSLDGQVVLRPSSDVVVATADERTLLLDLGTQRYFGLDEVGTSTWELMQEGCSLERVVERLEAEYDASRADLERDVRTFTAELLRRGLVRPV